MRKKIWVTFIALLAGVLVSSCARSVTVPIRTVVGPGDPGWVKKTMRRMTLEEKIGQMVAWQYSGNFVNDDSQYLKDLEVLVRKYRLGGLIIFGGELYETAQLTNKLQKMAKIPLLIASDLERGAGNQITGSTLFPPLMALGAANSEKLAHEMGRITALEGRAIGIHMTYAPVVDVNINPDNPIINTRSVGEDPELVGRITRAFIRGAQENGLIATAKHFPGHGDTALDSHSLLPTISGDRERLEKVELYPFRQAVEAGVQAIMTAHLHVPALDPTPNLPATLSPEILTGLLRDKIGFKGLIVTDAMTMGGITKTYSTEDAALGAVLAGVDMLLLPPQPARVVDYLVGAARSGKISPARIDQSVRRILEAKARLGIHKNRFVSMEALGTKIAPKAHLEQSYLTFESAATLVKNDGPALPLDRTKKIAVLSLSSDLGDYFAGRNFVREVQRRASGAAAFYADADTGQETLDEYFSKAAGMEAVVLALFSTVRAGKGSVDLDARHIQLIKKLAEGEAPVVVVSFGSPYFLKHFPDVEAYINLYRNTPQTQEIGAKAIFGEVDFRGRLPVSIPGLYPIGHGLELKK